MMRRSWRETDQAAVRVTWSALMLQIAFGGKLTPSSKESSVVTLLPFCRRVPFSLTYTSFVSDTTPKHATTER
jgi:hypothetical protein